jgi:hypothetical protein
MATGEIEPSRTAKSPFANPWPPLAVGLALTGIALSSNVLFGRPNWLMPLLGVFAAGIGVAIRPNCWRTLLAAALTGFLSVFALPEVLDSIRLMLSVLTGVAAAAAVLVVLPRMLRRLVISLLIVFHFVGIATAITCVPPSPWLSSVLWGYVYRMYLEFIYMQNAYHFYSPEPGPACMMWFYVKYEDGSAQWVKIPRREDFQLALEYQRRLSLTESINQGLPTVSIPKEKRTARYLAASEVGIPPHPLLQETLQYREPTAYSKRMLETYTRFIARHTPHPTDKEKKVTSIKTYRVLHLILSPNDIKRRTDPDDPTNYYPFFHGEYTPDGKLRNPDDPFLYWMVPIVKTTQLQAVVGRARREDQREMIVDYCAMHAALGESRNLSGD